MEHGRQRNNRRKQRNGTYLNMIKTFHLPRQYFQPWVLDFFCMLLVPNNPKVFITWVANERVPQFERLSDEELIKGITATLEKFLGDKYNVTKPEKITRFLYYYDTNILRWIAIK